MSTISAEGWDLSLALTWKIFVHCIYLLYLEHLQSPEINLQEFSVKLPPLYAELFPINFEAAFFTHISSTW